MNALEQLSQAFGTLASYPEHKAHTEKDLNEVYVRLEEQKKNLETLREVLTTILAGKTRNKGNRYEFVLDHERPNESWNEIVKKGQEIQQPFWEKGEERWNRELGPSPKGVGWYGTVSMPIITILCTEPEYIFHETKRLPGRFQLRSASRWGPALRFDGTGDNVMIDSTRYGHCYHEPIGIYVEPSTKLPSGMIVRPFEQGIKDCVIVGTNNVLPIYLADNPDRCHITGNKIVQHLGGFFGIKHGPHYITDGMPLPARPNDPVWITETRICGNQFEGPHGAIHPTGSRKKAGVFFTGQYCHVQNNSFFGWDQCIYSHGGMGRVITGNTAAHGETGDGRSWGNKDQMVMATVCQDGKASDSVGMNAGGFKSLTPSKRSTVTETAGWHNKGEAFL